MFKSEKINGIDGDFGSQQRYKSVWVGELDIRYMNKNAIRSTNLSIKESLTINLRDNNNFNPFEIILHNLGLAYKDNKNKYKNKNEMIKLEKKIFNVIKWLFKQLTNNNKEPFVMKW